MFDLQLQPGFYTTILPCLNSYQAFQVLNLLPRLPERQIEFGKIEGVDKLDNAGFNLIFFNNRQEADVFEPQVLLPDLIQYLFTEFSGYHQYRKKPLRNMKLSGSGEANGLECFGECKPEQTAFRPGFVVVLLIISTIQT